MFAMLVVVTPILIVAIFNVLVILTLKRSSKMRSDMTSAEGNNHRSITHLLIGMATVFTICNISSVVMVICLIIFGGQLTFNEPFTVFTLISNILVIMNAACNFWLYCACSKKFRQALFELLKCSKDRKAERSSSSRLTELSSISGKM